MEGRKRLRKYLRETGKTQMDLVREGPFDSGAVARWLSGIRAPNLASAVRLEKVTDGKVPAESWVQ